MNGREQHCIWHFSDQPNTQEIGPNNAMEQSFKQHPYASLVRESIQNSLDAVYDKTKPVVVEFQFKKLKGIEFPRFFDLKTHIQGCLDYFSENVNAKAIFEPMLKWFARNSVAQNELGYIRVSDYNTKGMSYDEHDTSSPFYAFVRSAGVSSKESTSAGGSFGFGKAAYFLVSPISSIIVSTCTLDNKKYFEGISSLCTHTYNGKKKMAVGYYDNNNGMPIIEEDHIPVPFRRTEPGTDINIMGFRAKAYEDAIEEMTEAVLQSFWLAIFHRKLVVKIGDNIIINSSTITDLMTQVFPDGDKAKSKYKYENPRRYYEAVSLVGTTNQYVYVEDNLPLLGHVCLFVNKQKGAIDRITYLRDLDMTVYSKNSKTPYGIFGVFYCDSPKGNEILRKLENPSHDQWKASNWRNGLRPNSTGKAALKEMDNFITESLASIFAQKEKETITIRGLDDFLYIPTSYDDDEDLNSESYVGSPTGSIKDDGYSFTTAITETDQNPVINKTNNTPSSGTILINKPDNAAASSNGDRQAGHGKKSKKKDNEGILKPGDLKEKLVHDSEGKYGVYATPLNLKYRTFFQQESYCIYHYVILHSDEDIDNVRLTFFSAGETSDDILSISQSSIGSINGNILQGIHLNKGRNCLRLRFNDNMKHSIKLSSEQLHEK